MLAITAASAQEPKTIKVTQPLNETALYEVKDDGTVFIDWTEVETFAASKQNPFSHPRPKSCWRSVIGKWKAMDNARWRDFEAEVDAARRERVEQAMVHFILVDSAWSDITFAPCSQTSRGKSNRGTLS
ncbi:hypothetical protein [Nitrobacter sp.]|uniref:hypothetical protein n=1 Tax=Nitrobacter sp. TaxID=29420 RepID=UPI00321FD49B